MPPMGLFIWGGFFPETFIRLTANERGEVDGKLWDEHELVDTVANFAREIKESKGLEDLHPLVRFHENSTVLED